MRELTVYTDGSCKGNPGPGGWGAILTYGDREKIIRGGKTNTTNNIMELTAVIETVKWLNENYKRPCHITFVSDSRYVMMTKEKWAKWKKRKEIPNLELWETLISEGNKGKHLLSFQHVKGHTGEVMNERCDYIAREQASKFANGEKESITYNDALSILGGRIQNALRT